MNGAEPNPVADTSRLRRAVRLAVSFAAVLWLIKLGETLFGLDLTHYGIYPRDPHALTGILAAPLIHGSWSHLAANTLPVIVLGTGLFYGYPRSATRVLLAVWLGSGVGVWLFAREAFHIGASGLTFGVMFFLFVIGALRWDTRAIVIALIVFFLYGSMIWGIFPQQPGISFESHFFGATIGVLSAILLKNRDPAPAAKTYSWEGETEDPDALPDEHDPDDTFGDR